MILSSEELEIIEYLKSWNGKYVTMIEICRCAAGRRKFRETPNWAKGLMVRLVDTGYVSVNERGHYRWIDPADASRPGQGAPSAPQPPAPSRTAVIVGDDYFPAAPEPIDAERERWMSPQIAEILKKSGKNFGGSNRE